MASISDKQKKRGRPKTGETPMVGIRLGDEMTARVDVLAEAEGISRSEAIRRLVERGLASDS